MAKQRKRRSKPRDLFSRYKRMRELRGKPSRPAAWVFKHDPNRAGHPAVGEEHDYSLSTNYRDKRKQGDWAVFCWVGEGVHVLVKLISDVFTMDVEEWPEYKHWVRVRGMYTFTPRLSLEEIKRDPVLRQSAIPKGRTSWPQKLTEQEWEALMRLFPPEARKLIKGDKPMDSPIELLQRALEAEGLHYERWQLAAFFTALQVKGFVILSGISGTGKTRLAQQLARLLPQSQGASNWLFVPVRPDWRDGKGLLGYYNPLTGTYERTAFLDFVLRARDNWAETPDRRLAWFVILDEMNLAHVEYYFADLLSVLESGRNADGCTAEPLRLSYPADATGDLPPREVRLPPNLYVVGTVNVDETTQAFSPKVLDRAFSIELGDVSFKAYLAASGEGESLSQECRRKVLGALSRGGKYARIEKAEIRAYLAENGEVRDQLQSLNERLEPHGLHFGYRVFDEIVAFLSGAKEYRTFEDSDGAFDAAVLIKVLPKFHGSRGKLEMPLRELMGWCVNPRKPDADPIGRTLESVESGADVARILLGEHKYQCPRTAARAARMLQALYTDGFAAFG